MTASELLNTIDALDGYGLVVEDESLVWTRIVDLGFEKDKSFKQAVESVESR